jgi:hypothetical protein
MYSDVDLSRNNEYLYLMSLLEQHVLDNLVFLRHADLQATAVETGAPPTEDPIQQRRRKKVTVKVRYE